MAGKLMALVSTACVLSTSVSGLSAQTPAIDPSASTVDGGPLLLAQVKGKGTAPPVWRARGNEPFWSLALADGKLTLLTDLGQNRTEFAAPKAVPVDGGFGYAVAGDRKLVATLQIARAPTP